MARQQRAGAPAARAQSRTRPRTLAVLALLFALAPVDALGRERFVLVDRPSPGHVELGYALALREDQQAFSSSEVSATGPASRLRLDADWFLQDLPIGAALRLSLDRFVLSGADSAGAALALPVTGWSAALGLAARAVWIDSFSIVADLGYGYSRSPLVEARALSTSASRLDFHGPWAALSLGMEGRWAPRLRASGSPLLFGQSFAGASKGWQLAAGAELGVGIFGLGPTKWSAVLAYDYALTRFSGVDQGLDQRAHLFSLALRGAAIADKKRVDLPPPTGPGSLRGLAAFDEDGKPAAGLAIEVAGAGPVSTDAQGAFAVARAGPGPVVLRAELPGYRALERTVVIPPEEEATVELRLVRRSGPGSLRGSIVALQPGQSPARSAVPGASIELADGSAKLTSAADGTFLLQSVGPGPVELRIAAPGFQPGEEVVVVAPETEAQVEIVLIRLKAKAVVRGLVRSLSGEPLEAKVQYASTARGTSARGIVKSNAKGEFLFAVPSGTYRLTIHVPGHLSQTKTIEVGEGDQAIFNVDMHPSKAQPRKR